MKRSEMTQKMLAHLKCLKSHSDDEAIVESLLKLQEKSGMKPPGVWAKTIMGKDFPFGAGCSMFCNCENCNPEYVVYRWEKE